MTEKTIEEEIEQGSHGDSAMRRKLEKFRACVERHPRLRVFYRGTVAAVGLGTIMIGVVLLVAPGPGWLMIFLGLAILSTEFASAQRVSRQFKAIVTRVLTWWRRRRAGRRSASQLPRGSSNPPERI